MVKMAQATVHMMMRPAGLTMDAMSPMMTACMIMGKACAVECRTHADVDEMYHRCTLACNDMAINCKP